MSDDDRPEGLSAPLLDLANRYGVVPDFWGFDGTHKWVSHGTMVDVLAALGVDASSPERVTVSLQNAEDEIWRRMLPPVVVLRAGASQQVPVHVADGAAVHTWLELDLEAGGGARDVGQVDVYTPPRTVDGRPVGRATVELTADLPLGWHTLHATSEGTTAQCTVVVTPQRLELGAGLEERRGWGFMAQLYSVRSQRSWGLGDLADLADLAYFSGRQGADFLLINPLHAGEPVPPLTPSPYLPTTRRFVSPLYLRPEEILECAYLPVAERSLVEWQAEVVRPLSTDPGPIDRDAVWAAKRVALEVIFAAPRSAARQARLEAFRAEQGGGLEDFATWCALAEHFEGAPWPAEADDRGSELVRSLRERLAERITFHCWLQWVADDQLRDAQRSARDGG
ncbi:MAG TPA: 4-alpha-glucanotransferase, partial [Actinotalea sp.]|nr:4-alpha-glucanotransferase [Actinotalea sp.]